MKWLLIATFILAALPLRAQPVLPFRPQVSAKLEVATKQIGFRVTWITPAQVDSTMVAVFLGGSSTPAVYRRARSPDTVTFNIPDDTTTYKFVLVSLRGGLVSLPANVNFYFNADQYYSISNILVRPDTITVKPGTTIQFCAFPTFADGTVAMRDKDAIIPECVIEYNKFNDLQKKNTGSRLRNANLACFVWQTTGGTISTETCSNQ